MTLFTYLKIILLQCFHFLIFNHKSYSNISKFNLNKHIYIYICIHARRSNKNIQKRKDKISERRNKIENSHDVQKQL